MSVNEEPAPQPEELFNEVVLGAKKSFDNAEQLFKEARLLYESGALSRALALHQISLEECAKVELLGHWSVRILAGGQLNVGKLRKSITSHKVKNKTNAYLLPLSDKEREAAEKGDWEAKWRAFNELKDDFHHLSNNAKNDSLYVDLKDGKFVAPAETISEKMVVSISGQNIEYLELMRPKVEMMLAWRDSDFEELSEKEMQFLCRIEELVKEVSDDPEKDLAYVLERLLAESMAALRPGDVIK